ncbi:hypothetical protein PVAP13_7NG244817 [Panicum virgatum]|uniref:Uncharacterized protein n=1 Tax=Panicum virgatum TaxID=38727 RepID=A0A8T0PWD2_PANVG|nr:hypothetical protein PVAP13_7NG244817 [Panicum virgatum]
MTARLLSTNRPRQLLYKTSQIRRWHRSTRRRKKREVWSTYLVPRRRCCLLPTSAVGKTGSVAEAPERSPGWSTTSSPAKQTRTPSKGKTTTLSRTLEGRGDQTSLLVHRGWRHRQRRQRRPQGGAKGFCDPRRRPRRHLYCRRRRRSTEESKPRPTAHSPSPDRMPSPVDRASRVSTAIQFHTPRRRAPLPAPPPGGRRRGGAGGSTGKALACLSPSL